MNEGQIPNIRVVRVALGTGYNRVEVNRRASRNGRVSDLPPEIPNVPIRNLFTGVLGLRHAPICWLTAATCSGMNLILRLEGRTFRLAH